MSVANVTVANVTVDNDWYSKRDAMIISSLGILLMLAHHLFGFKSFLNADVGWDSSALLYGIEIERIIAAFGKICVGLYAFNSGYVIWKFQHSYSSYKKNLKRCLSFLVCYWIILCIFWLYAFIIGDNLPAKHEIIFNLLGLATGPDMPFVNIPFAWYVAYYVMFLLITPCLIKMFSYKKGLDLLLFLLFGFIIYKSGVSFINPLIIGIEGIIFAKYSVFNRLSKIFPVIPIYVIFIFEVLFVVLRQGYILLNINIFNVVGGGDFLIVPLFIYCTTILFRRVNNTYFDKVLLLIATCSMNLWFLHGIFFTASRPLQTILYASRIPICIYFAALLSTFSISLLLYKLQQRVISLLNLK